MATKNRKHRNKNVFFMNVSQKYRKTKGIIKKNLKNVIEKTTFFLNQKKITQNRLRTTKLTMATT